jgi:hypothetical protein
MKLSSLYSLGPLLHLHNYLSTNSSLGLSCINYMASLPEICNGIGLVFIRMIALCHLQRCRVIFSNVSAMLRLLNIIKWCYMPRNCRDRPLMVTAQYGYSSTCVYRAKKGSWCEYSSISITNWMAMIDYRKELGNQGWFLDIPGEHSQGIIAI